MKKKKIKEEEDKHRKEGKLNEEEHRPAGEYSLPYFVYCLAKYKFSVFLDWPISRGPPNKNLYAMKAVERETTSRNKLQRAETEKEILGMHHHPFFPMLYSQFGSSHYSCFVME
ncbi:hypothetical protein Sjap_015275 [Stephania japonica]|uniref:non-specific serine/threonine protein kinase n=1 Tax=Stephania japonica TaxID=461633 RepID=A0AAP0IJW6_9MAGN